MQKVNKYTQIGAAYSIIVYIRRTAYSLLVLSLLLLIQCKREEIIEICNHNQSIGEYLENHPDEFSTFNKVLEKSETITLLKDYGTYTVFAPTNEAFEAYFASKGKTIDEFSVEELKDLVDYHIIPDTIPTLMLIDGRLKTANLYGQYLTSLVNNEDGSTVYKINRYAELDMMDNRFFNGILHSVKTVLEPVTATLAELIEANPEYRIFTEALKATGYYDTLNIRVEKGEGDPKWFTAIVVPNSAYTDESINSFNDLKEKYSHLGNSSDSLIGLGLYVAYHILDHQSYITDLQASESHETMAPSEVITIRTVGTIVKINEDNFDDEWETGYEINREESDNTANNGVYHVMKSDFTFKVPYAIYWEPTAQPEIMEMPDIYGKIGTYFKLKTGQLKDITWEGGSEFDFEYRCEFGTPSSTYPFVLHDYFNIYLKPEAIKWVEFKTPILVKGRYKVWICTRSVYFPPIDQKKPRFYVYFNDEVLPVVIDNNITLNEGKSEEEYALQGLKWYTFNPSTDSTAYRYISQEAVRRYLGQLAGTIDVKTTGRHRLKFVSIWAGSGGKLWLDQIHFIPVNENDPNDGQIWPRSNVIDNTPVYKEGLPEWIEW